MNPLESAFNMRAPAPSNLPARVHTLPDDDAPSTSHDLIPLEGVEPLTLADCEHEMRRAFAEFQDHAGSAIRAGCAIGVAARHAKNIMPHGTFMPWLDKTFPFSGAWARACMRASEAWELGLSAPKSFAPMLADATTVEKLAALLRPLQGKAPKPRGVLKINPPETPSPAREGVVTDVTPKRETLKETERAQELDRREAALVRREKALDAKAARLDKREEELNERERNLVLAASVPPPAPAESPIDALKRAKLAADAKANEKARRAAGAAAGSPAKPPAKGVVAPARKTAPKPSIADAAAVARPDPAPIVTTPDTPETVAFKAGQAAAVMNGLRDAVESGGTSPASDDAPM